MMQNCFGSAAGQKQKNNDLPDYFYINPKSSLEKLMFFKKQKKQKNKTTLVQKNKRPKNKKNKKTKKKT